MTCSIPPKQASDSYRKNITAAQRHIVSQSVSFYHLGRWAEIRSWLNDNATWLDYIPSAFTTSQDDLTNTWASRPAGLPGKITIWIPNDDLRTQFKLTWL